MPPNNNNATQQYTMMTVEYEEESKQMNTVTYSQHQQTIKINYDKKAASRVVAGSACRRASAFVCACAYLPVYTSSCRDSSHIKKDRRRLSPGTEAATEQL